jgi:hypothetical protein
MVSTDHFRQELRAQLARATTTGLIDVLVNSGELLSLYHQRKFRVRFLLQAEFRQGATLLLDRTNGAGRWPLSDASGLV